jgi:uncharacterized SAM-binding protein YcdF (DUF218 family)
MSLSQAMAQLAQELGVDRQAMILETQSDDTESEARLVAPIVGQQPFILVTEASHLPRAVGLFRKQGTHPLPDPMGYYSSPDAPVQLPELFPDADNLHGSQRAIYEYLGLAWAKLRGKI